MLCNDYTPKISDLLHCWSDSIKIFKVHILYCSENTYPHDNKGKVLTTYVP